MDKETFVGTYLKDAEKAERKTGVPALFALAQSALESGWGKHTPGNMLFGIKVGSGKNYGGWTGDKQLLTTTEYSGSPSASFPYIYPGYPTKTASGKWKYKVKSYFRAYPSPAHAIIDWAGLLTVASRYAPALKYRDDPYRFAEEVARAGYATDPSYAAKVKKIMGEIAGMVQSGVGRRKPWRIILPLAIILAGSGLIIYGIVKEKKQKRT